MKRPILFFTGQKRTWTQYGGTWFYQTNALIQGGNSGGPWVNANGELVAITSWGQGYTGNVNFGVPVWYVKELYERSSIK